LLLCLLTIVGWKRGKEWDRRSLIDVSILAGMLVAPIGWSYDQVMLLFPLLRILEWAANGSLTRKDAIAVILALITVDALSFYVRIFTTNEVWFFWVPLAVAAVYGFAWQRRQVNFVQVAIEVS